MFFDQRQDLQAVTGRIDALLAQSAANGFLASPPADVRRRRTPGMRTGAQAPGIPGWHRMPVRQLLTLVDTSRTRGLDSRTAERRLQTDGLNLIHDARLWGRTATLKDQFMLLPLALLLAEAAGALAGGAVVEAALLAVAAGCNALVGYLIDRRAEKTIAAFKHRPRPPAQVLRGGAWTEIAGEMLVAGDIVKLVPGTYVVADCRLLQTAHLKIDESLLTGESHPVDKGAGALPRRTTALFEHRNMAFMGTLVVGGEGRAVVVATGSRTMYGQLNALFRETRPPQTPMIAKIHTLSQALLRVALVLSGGVLASGLLRGRGPLPAFGRAVTIAAAGMPAGLPSAATVNMALGFQRLARENISLRRPYSLESLSAVQMICFDKTGTLTRSRISVQVFHCAGNNIHLRRRAFWDVRRPFAPRDDPDCRLLLEACVLCAESKARWEPATGRRRISGSPTEVALMHLDLLAGCDPETCYRKYPLEKVRHRSDTRRFMLTVHTAAGRRRVVWLKGDPAEVLEMCAWQRRGGRRIPLADADRQTIENQNQKMAGEGLRVLGFARGHFRGPPGDRMLPSDLTWVGQVGMAEPIREDVVPLIDWLHAAGIRTVMITGDQSATAEAVARRIRLGGRDPIRIFDSSRFDALPPAQAAALIRNVQVFSRFNPAQKLQIIQAYHDQGLVVAMTGDGINDGPALRAADVGIAMGLSGTHAAREVADMVLGRDNIGSVATAIHEGRAAYRNLKRALRYFIATHFSEVLLATTAASFAQGAALRRLCPVQLSLLTDLAPGLALLKEPARPGIIHEPPRDRQEPLFDRRDLSALLAESGVLAAGSLAAFGYGLVRYGPGARAATLAYETLAAAKLLHARTCRPWPSAATAASPRFANPWLDIALIAALAAQAGSFMVPGLRRLLRLAPLAPTDLAAVGLTAWTTQRINRRIRGRRRFEKQSDWKHRPRAVPGHLAGFSRIFSKDARRRRPGP